jgi:hypothetical protein
VGPGCHHNGGVFPVSGDMPNLQRLAKWRTIFTGWQLGTRPKGDPESDAVRDHREATLILRAEASALTSLLLDKGVFTFEEYTAAIEREADLLCMSLEARFPGMKATDAGMQLDRRAAQTMKDWRP